MYNSLRQTKNLPSQILDRKFSTLMWEVAVMGLILLVAIIIK
jgi:hypothetical protein